jgi:hypothetical protein
MKSKHEKEYFHISKYMLKIGAMFLLSMLFFLCMIGLIEIFDNFNVPSNIITIFIFMDLLIMGFFGLGFFIEKFEGRK